MDRLSAPALLLPLNVSLSHILAQLDMQAFCLPLLLKKDLPSPILDSIAHLSSGQVTSLRPLFGHMTLSRWLPPWQAAWPVCQP